MENPSFQVNSRSIWESVGFGPVGVTPGLGPHMEVTYLPHHAADLYINAPLFSSLVPHFHQPGAGVGAGFVAQSAAGSTHFLCKKWPRARKSGFIQKLGSGFGTAMPAKVGWAIECKPSAYPESKNYPGTSSVLVETRQKKVDPPWIHMLLV